LIVDVHSASPKRLHFINGSIHVLADFYGELQSMLSKLFLLLSAQSPQGVRPGV
jgi:hypothetical protein